jgi:two-component system, sensor histidine kinase and response regulator
MASIILIEDNLPLQKSIETLLSLSGYQVTAFDSGAAALNTLALKPPSLVLCDILLPEMDGFEILRRTRKLSGCEHVPFVFLSALAERDQVREGMNLGADDYITKPFTSEGLLAAIKVRLERANALQSLAEIKLKNYEIRQSSSLPQEMLKPLKVLKENIGLLHEEVDKCGREGVAIFRALEEASEQLEGRFLRYLLFLELRAGLFVCANREKTSDAGLAVVSAAMEQAWEAKRDGDLVLKAKEGKIPFGEGLHLIVSELVANAFKFSEPGTKVEVNMTFDDDILCVTCRDFGRGMTLEEIDEIGPFVRFGSSVLFQPEESKQNGLGLGLAICRAIVNCAWWDLLIQPAEGGGLLVTLCLPLND